MLYPSIYEVVFLYEQVSGGVHVGSESFDGEYGPLSGGHPLRAARGWAAEDVVDVDGSVEDSRLGYTGM